MFAIRKWNPFRELSTLHREMDELFRRTFGTRSGLRGDFLREVWCPSIEGYMKEGNFVVHAELPGIDPKNVDISISGNELLIRGERKASKDVKEEEYLLSEVCYGAFQRNITLPEGVKADKISATYKNGILEIVMPAEKAALPRKIHITLEGAEEKIKKVA